MVTLLLATALAVATPAFAGDTPAAAPPAKTKTGDPDRIVCKTQEETSSRLGSTKICHTVAEWAAIAKAAAAADTQRPSKPN